MGNNSLKYVVVRVASSHTTTTKTHCLIISVCPKRTRLCNSEFVWFTHEQKKNGSDDMRWLIDVGPRWHLARSTQYLKLPWWGEWTVKLKVKECSFHPSCLTSSDEYAAARASLQRQFQSSFTTLFIPCYVGTGNCLDPGIPSYRFVLGKRCALSRSCITLKLFRVFTFSVHNTLYLELPVVLPYFRHRFVCLRSAFTTRCILN